MTSAKNDTEMNEIERALKTINVMPNVIYERFEKEFSLDKIISDPVGCLSIFFEPKRLRGEHKMSEENKTNDGIKNKFINLYGGMGFKVNANPHAVYEGTIPSGAYTLEWPQMPGDTFSVLKKETVSDKIITSDTDVTADVLAYLKKFLSPETKETFKKFGMNYSTGVLKYGRPGTGKTVGINKFVKQFLADHKGYVLYASNPKDVRPFAQHFRLDKNVPIVIVMEELELLIERGHEHTFLELLDGQEKIENIIYLATTNHIDRIPDRIKNRPSRFARVLEVKEPDHKTRHQYVLGMTGDEATANMIAEVTEGLVMDEIKHVVINVACFEADPKTAAAHFKNLASEKSKNNSGNDGLSSGLMAFVDNYITGKEQSLGSGLALKELSKSYSSN